MIYFKCDNCGKFFDEPNEVKTTYESYYGVISDLFPDSTPLTLYVCPYCGDDSIEELEDDEFVEED